MAEERKEFWRWPEYRHTIPGKDWKDAKVITAGVDIGSVSSKTAIMVDGELYAYAIMRTGSSSAGSAEKVTDWALEGTGLTTKDLHYTVGTGYGRVNVPFAQRAITEIACHARGANFLWGPSVRTVLDMGGQDCKAIQCDSRGKVSNFLMNDKCAAGTGRGMEVFADLMGVPIQDVGSKSMEIDEEPEPVSSTCVVFAKTEAVGLLRAGWPTEQVLAAYTSAMAERVVDLL
ncbi:MAG: acyl-CoA dehydratase activase, partial [Anaerolineae bacterium]|nr:acyl-CoA dehydratase activase [Anaerolineae bacterium]